MDYWNADGSFAEMCGNGVRVFARYLIASGLAEPGDGAAGGHPRRSRPGTRRSPADLSPSEMRAAPGCTTWERPGSAPADRARRGRGLGNPHLVCALPPGSSCRRSTSPGHPGSTRGSSPPA